MVTSRGRHLFHINFLSSFTIFVIFSHFLSPFLYPSTLKHLYLVWMLHSRQFFVFCFLSVSFIRFSANILLDPYLVPKIGDFGLAREGPQQQYTHVKVSRVHGTRPYLPDEFLRARKFSTKVDTFSFGVVSSSDWLLNTFWNK